MVHALDGQGLLTGQTFNIHFFNQNPERVIKSRSKHRREMPLKYSSMSSGLPQTPHQLWLTTACDISWKRRTADRAVEQHGQLLETVVHFAHNLSYTQNNCCICTT